MEEKFRHEDHNRQDKTRKPGYRGDFIQESQSKASTGHLKKFKRYLTSYKELSTQLMRQYDEALFEIAKRHLRRRWSLKDYRANNEPNAISNKIWKEQKVAAEHDLDIIQEAIRKAINNNWAFNMGADQGARQFMLILSNVRIRSDRIVPCPTSADAIEAPTLHKTKDFYIIEWSKK